MAAPTTLIVGSGIFGVTAALALRRRGHAVQLLDPGPLPHPLAASTDISKVIRLDYGPDDDYLDYAEAALAGWRRWNEGWPEPLFHETGVLFLAQAPMAPGGFEYESYRRLLDRGHRPERLDSAAIARRFPAWNADRFVDGYYNPEGGYAESGRVVARLVAEARAAGVALREGTVFERLLEPNGRALGVQTASGERLPADTVVLAAGSWMPQLLRRSLPDLADLFRSPGLPVFHLRPAQATPFEAERFPVFGADIRCTGYYGFPLHPEGVVKMAYHGDGRLMAPEAPERHVTEAETAAFRVFLAEAFPPLAAAPIVYTRICLYCDTWDGHFWIAPDPARPGLVLATGGSGHAFKFAPLLGEWIADAVEGRPSPALGKFRWRPEVRRPRSEEASRFQAQA